MAAGLDATLTLLTAVVAGTVEAGPVAAIGACVEAALPRDCPRNAYTTKAAVTPNDNIAFLISMPTNYEI